MNKFFITLGRLEGISFLLLLLLAMPLKYYAEWPLGVKVMGPVHGFLFLGYCAVALWYGLESQWSVKRHIFALGAAVFPCGTFLFEKSLHKKA